VKKERIYFTTNYRKAWIAFRKSDQYAVLSDTLRKQGIRQPYRDNILKIAFTEGWNASGAEIKTIE
jgi:hypothetical protein